MSDLNFRLDLLPVLSANWPSGTVASGVKGHWLSGTQRPPKTPMTVCFSARPTVSIQSHSPPPEGRTATPEISLQQNPTWFPSPASAAWVWAGTGLCCRSSAGTEGAQASQHRKATSHPLIWAHALCFRRAIFIRTYTLLSQLKLQNSNFTAITKFSDHGYD